MIKDNRSLRAMRSYVSNKSFVTQREAKGSQLQCYYHRLLRRTLVHSVRYLSIIEMLSLFRGNILWIDAHNIDGLTIHWNVCAIKIFERENNPTIKMAKIESEWCIGTITIEWQD